MSTDASGLAAAAWAGDLPAVEAALAAGADVNAVPDDEAEPPLHLAIEQQWVAVVRRLIAAGAELNRVPGRWSPLAHAIDIESDAAWQAHHELGHETTELTELLLAAGAVPTEDEFEIAEGYGNLKALALLRQYVGS